MKKQVIILSTAFTFLLTTDCFSQSYWTGSTIQTTTTGNIAADNGQVKGYHVLATNYMKSEGDISSDGNIAAENGQVKGFDVLATNLMKSEGNILCDANITAENGQVKGYDVLATNYMLCNGDIQSDANIRALNGEIKGYNLVATNFLLSQGNLTVDGITTIGNVSTPAGYKLYVETGILTEKVKVALSNDPSNWSDFVFNDDYELRSLNEVEEFIKENKHLPEIPSTEEVHANGLDLAQMDAKLLQKIEELTLYVIQQQKEINELKKKNK